MDGAMVLIDAKISVIVPVYQVEPYLRKCLNSITGQTYKNLEIILVDDGSPDSCGAICDEYAERDGRIKVIHQANRGVSSARNAGLDAATGDWIGFVDADDWIEPDMYEYLLQNAENHQADMAVCGFLGFAADGTQGGAFACGEMKLIDTGEALQLLLQNQYMSWSCCDKLARRSLWEEVRFPDIKIWEDLLVSCWLQERAKATVCLPEVKYHYYTRPGSGVAVENLMDRVSSWEKIADYYPSFTSCWPRLKPLLAGRCVLLAAGIWGAYYGAAKAVRKEAQDRLRKISDFCREHIQDALLHVDSGRAGRLALRLTPYPSCWAFFAARGISLVYRRKHKRPL